jgi:hypothetical protein
MPTRISWALVIAAIALAAAVVLAFLEVRGRSNLTARVASLEQRIARRDEAEPLSAEPCPERRDKACGVSIIALIAYPRRYDGLRIATSGTYVHGFELSAVFPGWKDQASNGYEGISVDDRRLPTTYGAWPVEIVGTFVVASKSVGARRFVGEFRDVTYVWLPTVNDAGLAPLKGSPQ